MNKKEEKDKLEYQATDHNSCNAHLIIRKDSIGLIPIEVNFYKAFTETQETILQSTLLSIPKLVLI